MAVKAPRKAPAEDPLPEAALVKLGDALAPLGITGFLQSPPADDRLERLIAVVGTLWSDPYARPHCRKSGGLPRPGCDCPVCVADVKLKALLAAPERST